MTKSIPYSKRLNGLMARQAKRFLVLCLIHTVALALDQSAR
ncbi:MAG: hypothetical protein ABI596_03230 [Pyrinomonadaceae bacterium]